MEGDSVDRKEFMSIVGRATVGCLCGAALGVEATLQAMDTASGAPVPGAPAPPQAPAKRIEFVDAWVPQFFAVMDAELDVPARRRVMAANGKACFTSHAAGVVRRADPVTREQLPAWVAERRAKGYALDRDAVVFEYPSPPGAAPAGACLCPMAEGQPARRLSPTFCWCSVGYVKEMHERVFGRPVNVELTESVLGGASRCRFRITLA